MEIRAELEPGDLEMLGHVRRPLDTCSKGKTIDLFFQFESPVKLSEVCLLCRNQEPTTIS